MNRRGCELFKMVANYISNSWDGYYGDGTGYGGGYNDLDFNTRKTKKRHDFSPVLLIYTTCYNCKHCGMKKEECMWDHCEDEPKNYKKKDTDFDYGDWG